MKMWILCLLFLTGNYAPLQARIGETFPDLIQRYGEPRKDEDIEDAYEFVAGGLQLKVRILNGRSGSEEYWTRGEDGEEHLLDRRMAQSTVDMILTINSGGKKWQEVPVVRFMGKERKVGDSFRNGVILRVWKVEGRDVFAMEYSFMQGSGILVYTKESDEFSLAEFERTYPKRK